VVSTHKDDDGDDATQEKKTSNNNNNNNNNKSCGCEAFFAHCAAQSYDGLFRELRPSYIYIGTNIAFLLQVAKYLPAASENLELVLSMMAIVETPASESHGGCPGKRTYFSPSPACLSAKAL
jgi:hypothetical protein